MAFEIPSKTQPMREAIILTFARLHTRYPEDGGFMSSHVKDEMGLMAGRFGFADFDIRSPTGKAFDRATEQLRAEGVLTVNPDDPNEIEYRLELVIQARKES